MKRKCVVGFFVLLLIGFVSCQKNNEWSGKSLSTDLQTTLAEVVGIQVGNITSGTEQSISTELFSGNSPAIIISGNGIPGGPGLPGWHFSEADHLKFGVPHLDSCVTVSVSSSSFPREIVIEYIKGCSTHKHDRSGKVIITLSDTITNAGAVQTIEYKDFYIDSMKVDLSATVKNLGINTSGNWVIEKSYVQAITKGDKIAVRSNSETQEWLTGFATVDKSDNSYLLSGAGSITINDTARYSRKITTALLYDASCEFIKSGVVELTRNGNVTVINYGDGTCDDKATITAADGTAEEISLHSNRFREGGRFDGECPGFGEKPPMHQHGR